MDNVKKYLLGIDNGGTTTKASLYTLKGYELACASVETEAIVPQPGFTERDMNEMWAANQLVIKNVIASAGVLSKEIIGVACCGHGKGIYLVDEKGNPIKGILSSDQRASEYIAKWKKDGTSEKIYQKTLQSIMACQPVALLAWLRDNEPEIVERIKWIFSCKDYVRFLLTGKAEAELSDVSGTNMLNLVTGKYDRELLECFGISFAYDMLPPICLATDICGTVSEEAAVLTGLTAGTPVFGGMFDINACAIAAGAITSDIVCMVAGTWSINEYICNEPITDGRVQMNSLFCIPGKYLIEESSSTSAGNNEWFVKKILGSIAETTDDRASSVFKLADGIVQKIEEKENFPIFLPFVMGSNMDPDAMGAFVGINQYHTQKHLIKSVYEGIVFSHKYHYNKLLAAKSSPTRVIRLVGGASRSEVWVQMFADILEMPVEVVDANESGALGCVIVAATALGEYESIEEATANMTRISKTVYPRPESFDLYRKRYELYISTEQALESTWKNYRELL